MNDFYAVVPKLMQHRLENDKKLVSWDSFGNGTNIWKVSFCSYITHILVNFCRGNKIYYEDNKVNIYLDIIYHIISTLCELGGNGVLPQKKNLIMIL